MNFSVLAVTIVCAALGFGIMLNVMPTRQRPKAGNWRTASADTSDEPKDYETEADGSRQGQESSGHSEWRRPIPEDWEMVLGVARGASAAEIRKAYLTLVQQYHPDRFGGAAPEIADYGAEKTKAINAAYLTAKRLSRV